MKKLNTTLKVNDKVITIGAERILLIKEVYCNGDTGELCAYLVCERK